jgi:hypothetical protein
MCTERQTIQMASSRALSACALCPLWSPMSSPARLSERLCGGPMVAPAAPVVPVDHNPPPTSSASRRTVTSVLLCWSPTTPRQAHHATQEERARSHARTHAQAHARAPARTPGRTRRHPHGGVRASFYWSDPRGFLQQILARLPVSSPVARPCAQSRALRCLHLQPQAFS